MVIFWKHEMIMYAVTKTNIFYKSTIFEILFPVMQSNIIIPASPFQKLFKISQTIYQ